MKLIVGLGNPGNEYAKTRHNAGFLVLDELANRLAVSFSGKIALKGEVGEAPNEKLVLLKPSTFMNLSGEAVKAAAAKYRIAPKDILIVLDDADIAFSELRLRESGSAAGHNGMKSILEQFPADTSVARLKVGIGRDESGHMPLDEWVLAKWTKEEAAALPNLVSKAADKAQEWYG
ncbi:aminoacyl-tRNA hydrolase [Patescibacteria group bacterium]|nr:MAG: aminoacyl-tRNA hydrolase [Patescibacteria group bacterium]